MQVIFAMAFHHVLATGILSATYIVLLTMYSFPVKRENAEIVRPEIIKAPMLSTVI